MGSNPGNTGQLLGSFDRRVMHTQLEPVYIYIYIYIYPKDYNVPSRLSP